MRFSVSSQNPASPISEFELGACFAGSAEPTDAARFWSMIDGDIVDGEWSNADVRLRFYGAIRAAGCGRRLLDGVAHFIFADGTEIAASRSGITQG